MSTDTHADRQDVVRMVPLCNMCRFSSSVLSGALIKGSTAGHRSFSETSAMFPVSQPASREGWKSRRKGGGGKDRGSQLQYEVV